MADFDYRPSYAPVRHEYLAPAFNHNNPVSRYGENVFHSQKVFGRSMLEMTRRHTNLITFDLKAVHQRVSLSSYS